MVDVQTSELGKAPAPFRAVTWNILWWYNFRKYQIC